MRASSGRAVTATIHQRLRDALLQGRPLTYEQLAQQAGCTVRSVRNYLSNAEPIFGFTITKTRKKGSRTVLVSAVVPRPKASERPPTVQNLLGDVLTEGLFHSKDAATRNLFVLPALDGWPAYERGHQTVLEAWLEACKQDPWVPVRLSIRSDVQRAEKALWPLAVSLHATQGILLLASLVGSSEAFTPTVIALADTIPERNAVHPVNQDLSLPLETRRDWRQRITSSNLVRYGTESPSTWVDLHLRFEADLVPSIRRNIWDPAQHVVFRRDGSMDLLIPHVPLDWAASLACSFGRNAEVIGDKKLRKAVKKRNFSKPFPTIF